MELARRGLERDRRPLHVVKGVERRQRFRTDAARARIAFPRYRASYRLTVTPSVKPTISRSSVFRAKLLPRPTPLA